MKVLITGANGLLGHSALTQCVKRGYDVTAIDNGFRNSVDNSLIQNISVIDFVANHDCCFDMVYHFAAINGTDHFYNQPNTVLHNNLLSDLKLFDWIKPKTRLVYASSSEIVSGNQTPTAEDVDITIENIHNPRWSYRIAKIASENFLVNGNLDYVILRYFNVFGERSTWGHFFWDIIQKLQMGEPCLIGGFETRSFCHVDDAAWATIELSRLPVNGVVNVGNPEEIVIISAANIIAKTLGYHDVQWKIESSRPGSVERRAVNIDRLKQLVPHFSPRSFEQAVRDILLTTT